MNTIAGQHKIKLVCLSMVFVLLVSFLRITAQGDGLDLIQTAEYDIGLNCPVGTALDPTGTAIWVLMNNCFRSNYVLHVYDIADGTQINEDDYADMLVSLSGDNIYVDKFITPMGFTPAGDLSIHYSDNNFDIPQISTLIIPLASGGEVITESSEAYNDFLAEYSEYPDFSVYSPDHTKVVASGTSSFHILDVESEIELVEIPIEGGTDYAFASFSRTGEHLHVIRYSEDMDVMDATLVIYRLSDAELLHEYDVPSTAVYVSPDETYAAVNLYSNHVGDQNELIVMNLETGVMSAASNLDEAPHSVPTCLNDGRNVSDIDYRTTGLFSFPDIHWLADNSGVVLALSYGGENAGSGTPCIFNYSRLRRYTVEASD